LPYAAVPYPIPAPASDCGGRTLLPAAPPRYSRDPADADAAPLLPPPRRAHEPHGDGLVLPLQPAALQADPGVVVGGAEAHPRGDGARVPSHDCGHRREEHQAGES